MPAEEGVDKEEEGRKFAEQYPEFKTLFDTHKLEGTGRLTLAEVRKALKELGHDNNKPTKTLFRAIDADGAGDIGFSEFCWMGEALLHDIIPQDRFKGLDVERFRNAFKGRTSLKSQFKKNLIEGYRTGELETLLTDAPENDGKVDKEKEGQIFRDKYPAWWDLFQSSDKDSNGSLNLKEIRVLMSKVAPRMGKAIFDELFKVCDRNNTGGLDWCEFAWMGEGFVTRDAARFGDDANKFRQMFADADATRKKAMGMLKTGLKTGEVGQLLENMPEENNDNNCDKIVEDDLAVVEVDEAGVAPKDEPAADDAVIAETTENKVEEVTEATTEEAAPAAEVTEKQEEVEEQQADEPSAEPPAEEAAA